MKKTIRATLCLAMVLAMVMAMSLTGFAATGYNSNPGDNSENPLTDTTSFTFTKHYTLVGAANGSSPAEDFTVSFEPYTVKNAPTSVQNKDIPAIDPITLAATLGNASASGVVEATVTLPDYPSFGDYWYKVSESAGSTAGVHYDARNFYLHVQVIKQGTDLVRLVTLHQGRTTAVEGENPWLETKEGSTTNTYSNGTVTILKTVTGSQGDHDKAFNINVVFTYASSDSENCPIKSVISYEENATTKTLGDWTYDSENSQWKNEVTIALKHNQSVTFNNIPYGVAYSVKEENYSGEGYIAPVYGFSSDFGEDGNVYDLVSGDNWNNKVANGTISDDADKLTIANKKDAQIDVGVIIEDAPFVALIGVAVLAAAAVVISRKKFSI